MTREGVAACFAQDFCREVGTPVINGNQFVRETVPCNQCVQTVEVVLYRGGKVMAGQNNRKSAVTEEVTSGGPIGCIRVSAPHTGD